MTLMSLVRWIGVIVIGWTLLAIGIGASGTRLPARDLPALPPSSSPSVEAMPTGWPTVRGYDLVDRTSGRTTKMRLPDEDRWWAVSVSPRPGPGGELEAVGRWVNPGREDFSGWALFRLSDGAVLSRIATEVLPMGRPCWVPGQARMILFAAGDGQLYRCRLAPEHETPVVRRAPVYASGHLEPSEPVVWVISPPGLSEPMLADPFWPADPRLQRCVFVALMVLERQNDRNVYGPSTLWWLELSDDARSVVAAGRLTEPTGDETASGRTDERLPNVAVGADGHIRLVYMERRNRNDKWRLQSAALELDPADGAAPSSPPASFPALPARPVGPFNPHCLLVSSDGATAYGLSKTGALASVRLPVGEAPAESSLHSRPPVIATMKSAGSPVARRTD